MLIVPMCAAPTPQSSLTAENLALRIFNTMDPGTIEISGYSLLQEFAISPSRPTQGIESNDKKFPGFFPGVMQRYFFSYMAALHLADHFFIEEVSQPNTDYEASKKKFLAMIQQLPEVLLKKFLKRNDHALKNIPCDLSKEQLFDLGEQAFDIITKNGHDIYNNEILQQVDDAFQKTKNSIAQDVRDYFKLDKNNPQHAQVVCSVSEQLQSFIENEEALSQDHVKAICDFLSGTYTVVNIAEEDMVALEVKSGLFCPDYKHGGEVTVPIIFRSMLEEAFLPIQKDVEKTVFCDYINTLATEHLKQFRSHLDNANRLVFALDQLRIRHQLLLENDSKNN